MKLGPYLAAIVESSDDAIIGKTLDGIITSWNKGAELIFGYSAEEVLGKSIYLLIPDDRKDEEPLILECVRRGDRIDHYHTVRKRKDGQLINISVTVSPIRDEDGRIIGASKIARDITDRERMHAALRESESRYRDLMQLLPVAVYACDAAGKIQNFNKAATVLWGREPKCNDGNELLSGAQKHYYPDGSLMPVSESPMALVLETKRPQLNIEMGIERADGSRRTTLASVIPLKNDEGELTGTINCLQDVTQQKLGEEDRMILFEREKEARMRAEEASRYKDEFLATVSHELRTPLNSILGWARLMRDTDMAPDTSVRAIETIERNAKSQAQLIEDILDVSRAISGRLRLDVTTIELIPLIEAAIDIVRPAAQAKGVKLHSVLDPNSGPISGDPQRMQQIVWNLLSNAVKFTPKNGNVQVRLQRAGSQAELTVSDTGIGIRNEFLPFVFDRFRQADSSSTRKFGGLGLGLAIVRHLTELHGGTVRAESGGEGKGASFMVRLPITIAHLHRSRDMQTARNVSTPKSAPNLRNLRVLVLDDEPDAREIITLILEECGAEVRSAASVSQALGLLEEWDAHVLLSDIGIPERDGYDFIREVRRLGIESPAIALTAYARQEDRLRILGSGYQMHISKPVDSEELPLVVASIAGRQTGM
jgi:PAS domain S-box-containing protein